MHCCTMLSFALHCIALHVHALRRKNIPNWGRAGFIKLYGSAHFLGLRSLGPLLFCAALCNCVAVCCAVLCGAERLSGGS